MLGSDALSRARETELLGLAEELLMSWNPVRTFGTAAGTMSFPAGAAEMLRWVYRAMGTIERWWVEEGREFGYLREGVEGGGEAGTTGSGVGGPTVAEIVLYGFLEFARDCYGVDLTAVVVKGKDVYGRDEGERGFVQLGEFLKAMDTRASVRTDADLGEVASEVVARRMQTWAEGVL